jgi:signal transduction histidine kinase
MARKSFWRITSNRLTLLTMGILVPFAVSRVFSAKGTSIPIVKSVNRLEVNGKKVFLENFFDITALKKTESDLKEEQMRTAATNEKLKIVGGLTRHDIRNKLSALNGNLYMLKKKISENAQAMQYMSEIDKAYQQIERILDFERVFEQVGSERLTAVDVGTLFSEASALIGDLKGVQVKCSVENLTLVADSLLRQVFYNLIDNSLKYGEKLKNISLHSVEDDESILLVYEDDGIGISNEVKAHLFEKGYGKSTGFGLFMVKKIIEGYGWKIEEDGVMGKGVLFKITIPKSKHLNA